MEAEEKIGLLGGSFDPIHNGHIQIALWAQNKLSLNRIIFIPASIPPHKVDITLTEPEHRFKMVQLAIEEWANFEISDIELKRKGISYTIDTVLYFRKHYKVKKENLFLLIGADSLVDFHKWKDPERILNNCQVVVYQRPGINLEAVDPEIKKKVLILEAPLINISSTEIRKKIKTRELTADLVPQKVIDYIYEHNLYTES